MIDSIDPKGVAETTISDPSVVLCFSELYWAISGSSQACFSEPYTILTLTCFVTSENPQALKIMERTSKAIEIRYRWVFMGSLLYRLTLRDQKSRKVFSTFPAGTSTEGSLERSVMKPFAA